MNKECETCIKRKTVYCPTSIECMATDDMPYYQNRIMLLEENQELKKQLEKYKDKINWYENFEINKTIDKLRLKYNAQQKEFIKWLENGIEKVKNTEFFDERIQKAGLIAYNRCLQKYKKIIGDKR